ncbi:hypothetical protein [Agaribacterium sp. ZY112]|uniref:hypothetical protein n=1 Tax=Agaribacterium sp. ZY112 TaxID=3233574 RepID=UPI0035251D58
MNFSKQMIDLVKEIRRRSSSDIKPSIKLANPDLMPELVKMYQESNDAVSKALIKELCHLSGEGWSDALSKPKQEEKRLKTNVYRGQTSVTEVKPQNQESPKKTKQVYRGRVVYA